MRSGPRATTARSVFTAPSGFGPTDATVRGRDWTNPALNVEHGRTGRGTWNTHPLEVYDHDHPVRHDEYDEGARHYRAHDAERRSRMHSERLDIARRSWTVQTTVVTAVPGRTFELVNSEEGDDRYLIVSVTGNGTTGEHGGEIQNTLEVIPVDVPYRPARPARRLMPGPETATVTGDQGEEIHTDEHGRMKVQFHWDRLGQNDAHSSAGSASRRAGRARAGASMFIPRVGMEVIVSFLDGDPDRPLVTGCRLQRREPPPVRRSRTRRPRAPSRPTAHPAAAAPTSSASRTRRAAKRSTSTPRRTSTRSSSTTTRPTSSTTRPTPSTSDQTQTVGHDQTLHVKNDRTKTVDVDEKNTIKGDRVTTVGPDGGDDTLIVKKNRKEVVEGPKDELVVTTGDKKTSVSTGKWDVDTKKRFHVQQNDQTTVTLNDAIHGRTQGEISWRSGNGKAAVRSSDDGAIHLNAQKKIGLHTSNEDIHVDANTEIVLVARTKIRLEVEKSFIEITPSKITVSAATVEVNGASTVDVKGGIVNLKP